MKLINNKNKHANPGLIMQRLAILFIGSLLLGIAAAAEKTGADLPVLLVEGGLSLQVPAGFNEIGLQQFPLFQHEKALREKQNKLEIRYVIRPLGRIEIDYDDPHSAMPEPNHMFNMLFHTLVGNLTKRGSRSPTREYSTAQSKELFNADWAAASVFDVVPEFSDQYSQALLLAIHKNDLADAYTVFLFDDYQEVKGVIQQSMSSLKFAAAD